MFLSNRGVPRVGKIQRRDSHTYSPGVHMPKNSVRLSMIQGESIPTDRVSTYVENPVLVVKLTSHNNASRKPITLVYPHLSLRKALG